LLVAFIPGLLMVGTFGLQRLEASLCDDTVSAADVVEFLQQAEDDDVNTLARDGMSSALDGQQRRLHNRESRPRPVAVLTEPTGLPTRVYVHHQSNPVFQPTRHANRV
jgi:hypothetical protein